MGHAKKTHYQHKRRAGAFIAQLASSFDFSPRWYRSGAAREKAAAYYLYLRTALRERPEIRTQLVRCRICRIFFVTDPRNAGRLDLRCPFGCQECDIRRRSSERSIAYYRTDEGKGKKATQNRLRISPLALARPASVVVLPRLISYLAMLMTLIEGRSISGAAVERVLRQQGFDTTALSGQTQRPKSRGPP